MLRKAALNIWSLWLLLTLIYALTFYASGENNNWHYIVNPPIGLFVPVFLGNLVNPIADYRGFITYPLLFAGLYLGDRFGRYVSSRILLRAALNLTVLAILSTVIDMILWSHPVSLNRCLEVWQNPKELIACCLHRS